jgi:Domain of unknown function (DUF4342)/zinc-ribbon domain
MYCRKYVPLNCARAVVTSEMDTCTKCGVDLVEGANYCYACGAVVEKASTTEQFSVSSDDVTKKVKELIHEGNVSRIIVKNEDGKNLLEIPVTAGAVGILLAPWLAAVGVIAALARHCTIVVVRNPKVPMQPLDAT